LCVFILYSGKLKERPRSLKLSSNMQAGRATNDVSSGMAYTCCRTNPWLFYL